MKLFSWMHKLNPSTDYSKVSSQNKETGTTTKEMLLHNVFDGILTIGTLGHEQLPHYPLLPFPSPCSSVNEDHRLSIQSNDKYKDQEAINVSINAVKDQANFVVVGAPCSVPTLEPIKLDPSSFVLLQNDKVAGGQLSNTEISQPLLKEDKERTTKPRITLADLLAATASEFSGSSANSVAQTSISKLPKNPSLKAKKQFLQTKHHGSRKNESMMKKEDESLPTPATSSKVHRLITGVLKKKIYPSEQLRRQQSDKTACKAKWQQLTCLYPSDVLQVYKKELQ